MGPGSTTDLTCGALLPPEAFCVSERTVGRYHCAPVPFRRPSRAASRSTGRSAEITTRPSARRLSASCCVRELLGCIVTRERRFEQPRGAHGARLNAVTRARHRPSERAAGRPPGGVSAAAFSEQLRPTRGKHGKWATCHPSGQLRVRPALTVGRVPYCAWLEVPRAAEVRRLRVRDRRGRRGLADGLKRDHARRHRRDHESDRHPTP